MTTWNELPAHLVSKVRSDSVTPASALPGCEPVITFAAADRCSKKYRITAGICFTAGL